MKSDAIKVVGGVLIIFMVIAGLIIGIKQAADSRRNVKDVPLSEIRVVDYRNGVYYFDSTEANFANALSKFISEHPELEFISAVADGTGDEGKDIGYFVVFKNQKLTPESPR
ncbi:MAG: Uncharacterized protein G01um101419_106 [Parcubacteria group bacterium Gr01-1014_19]|nr:MAG: Uncharacterized protein G01um101419_106 [Parcubacteria group bacterium Gr01-1014_19]